MRFSSWETKTAASGAGSAAYIASLIPEPIVSTAVALSAGAVAIWAAAAVDLHQMPRHQRAVNPAGPEPVLAAGIMRPHWPPGCGRAPVIVLAGVYLADQVCSYRLRVRFLSRVGATPCV